MNKSELIIVMGVSGSGKSTIGQALAAKLGIPFHDGDDFHPEANIRKMASGIPLDDTDRLPWLQAINRFATTSLQDSSVIIACSALKDSYRKILSKNIKSRLIFLEGSQELIAQRMARRQDHFMPPDLLKSQLDTLEVPKDAIMINIDQEIQDIVNQAYIKLEEK